MMRRLTYAVTIAAAALATPAYHAQSPSGWPQFLGPDRDNTTRQTIPAGATLAEAWRAAAPAGTSGIVVSGTRLITGGDDDEREFVVAFDVDSGRELWRSTLGPAHETADPQATPVIIGDTVVTVSATCVVHGLDIATGQSRWQKSLVTEFKSRLAPRACAMSPMIDGTTVVVPTGAPATGTTLAAFDAATGAVVWSAANLPVSLNTPAGVGTFNGERLVLYHHAKPPGTGGLSAVRVKGGTTDIAWQIDLKAGMSDTAPLALPGNRVLLQTWNDSALIDVSSTPRIVWTTTDLWALYPPPTHHAGVLYGFGGNSTEFFSAVDITSGRTLWTERIYRGYVVNAGGTLVVQSESAGLLRLVAADPARYRELARLPVFRPGARTTTPPTVAAGRIFVRNLDEIVAVSVRAGVN